MKPCSLENFLNKVDESLRSPFSLSHCRPCLFVVNKTETCTFILFFLLLYDVCFTFVDHMYIYYKYHSVHWCLFTFCLTWQLCLCITLSFFFCCSCDYVITELCENVNTKKALNGSAKLSRPAKTDDADFNASVLFILANSYWRWLPSVTFFFVFFEYLCMIFTPCIQTWFSSTGSEASCFQTGP